MDLSKGRAVLIKACRGNSSCYSVLVARVNQLHNFPNTGESERVIAGLKWIGLFSESKVTVRNGNPLDTLCAQLEKLMTYKPGERDLIVLQHKFYIEWEDGKEVCINIMLLTSYMKGIDREPGNPNVHT